MRGLGRRMLENGILPRPSSFTYDAGSPQHALQALALAACQAQKRGDYGPRLCVWLYKPAHAQVIELTVHSNCFNYLSFLQVMA